MSKYLVSIALGPVGDFIAAARRTRDLRAGSWLLSEVSKAVAGALMARGELIFPYSPKLEQDLKKEHYAVANKVLAVVDAEGEEELRALAQDLRGVAVKRLQEVASQAIREARIRALEHGALRDGQMRTQLDHFIEYYAAWVPYDEARHGECRADVEAWAGARKSLRNFDPHAGQAGLPKSSLDGIRETVVEKGGWREDQFFVKQNEQLDGMGIVKRFGGPQLRFDSTIDVAAGPYLLKLGNHRPAELERYWECVRRKEAKMPESAGYLYQLESRGPRELDEELADVIRKGRFPEPKPPYYAFFLGDGDDMGETISHLKGRRAHENFSERLSQFSASVHREAKSLWNIVFAGGDDVMAMLPLHEAIGAALTFRRCFQDAVKDLAIPKKPTFSAGLVVAHALEPLSEVRQKAKIAEQLAKSLPGKDALAVTIIPRSGAETTTCGHWDQIGPALQEAVSLYMKKEITPGYAYVLRDVLDSTGRRGLTHLDETLFAQARALAVRKQGGKQFSSWLGVAEKRAETTGHRQELRRLSELLLVARPFARAMREAQS